MSLNHNQFVLSEREKKNQRCLYRKKNHILSLCDFDNNDDDYENIYIRILLKV